MKRTFAELIHELGQELDIELELDHLNVCSIVVDEQYTVQLEQDKYKEYLILGSAVLAISPGKFRENVLATALKANDIYPRPGTLAYRVASNELILFKKMHLEDLTAKQIVDELSLFLDMVETWKKAVDSGNIASLSTATPTKKETPNPFNIK